MTERRLCELHVNGSVVRIEVDAARSLLSVLRDELDLTGTKYGCGEGQCGACVVLIDGESHPSCRTEVGAATGRQIVTIEGLAEGDELHPLQKAFLEAGAMQCGYCTPGMIVAAAALLATNPDPAEAEIIAAMDRHICRCGTYPRIVKAIQAAALSQKQARKVRAAP